MKGNKNISSIFDHCHETASQEIFLQRCGFARPGEPPESDPSVGASPQLNDGIATHRFSDDSETDSVIGSGYGGDAVESHAIRFVSPQESADTVELAEDAADPTVGVVAEKHKDFPVESNVDEGGGETLGNLLSDRPSSSSGNRRDERLESPAKGDGGKKLKIPLRDVVKAIVMNSRNTEEEDKETEKTSFVQILMNKGFNFPSGF